MEKLIHYHGTPITPRSVLYELAGKSFCVRYGEHRDIEVCHKIGQSVLVDNGAFPAFTKLIPVDWPGYYQFAAKWLEFHTTWAVIPDVIDGTLDEQACLIREWWKHFGHYRQAAPVWHLSEPLERLELLVNTFERVCFGSSGEYWQISTPAWNNRVNEAFNRICKGSGRPPAWIHMLRGMSLAGSIYPFASVDSTDVARNHEQTPGKARKMADRWDSQQCPAVWAQQPIHQALQMEANPNVR